ncbi:MAG TPA: acylphosphatase [Thermoplasmatales archaeon]|nr:acylphosphatase [Candidatus Thermoplasmatota archaeon]HDS59602.1 acylphosphatase [Thermoplasmatales archaeon]
MKRVHVWISGRVQGVWYRSHTQKAAHRQGVKGWVRNLPDGRVEAVFEGPEQSVKNMIDWCHRGSPMARVEDVEVAWEEPEGCTDFEVRH